MRRQTGYRLPARGLLPALLLALLPLGMAQAQAPCPEYWMLATRGCPQVLGTDPAPFLRAYRLESGRLACRDPAELIAASPGRPVILLIHGSYFTARMAAAEGLGIRRDLAAFGVIPPDALVVEFDWPSQLTTPNLIRDANEKARRAYVAGYHLARFLRRFPEGTRVSLVGHSHGALAALSALHLLGGGVLENGHEATVLASCGPRLRLRAVAIAPACDRHWLAPGERLGQSLAACEGVLCLYNPLDPALITHPFGRYSEHRRALGKAGMSADGLPGPLITRYQEMNIAPLLGPRHTFRGTTARPVIARSMAPYLWASEG